MRNKLLAGAAGLAVTVALLVWVLQDVSFADLWLGIRNAHWPYLVASMAIATLSFVIRVPRWQILLRQEDGSKIPALPLWHGIAIGFMANNLIPFRAGEVLRAVAISRLAKVRIPAALSSLVAERLFDALTIVAFLFVGLLTAGIPPDAEIGGMSVSRLATRLAIAPLALLAACVLTLAMPDFAKRMIRLLVPSARLADKLASFIDGLRSGLAALTSPRRVLAAAGWSILHWLNNALSFYVAFKAFDIPVNFGGAILMQSVLVVLIAAPSTPGYFGVFESAIKAVLIVFGINATLAVTYALSYHFATFAPITLLGLWSVSRTAISLKSAREDLEQPPDP